MRALVVIAVCVATLNLPPPVIAASAHKYVDLAHRKQNVQNIAIAKLPRPSGSPIPLVATAEADQITSFAWNETTSSWTPFHWRRHARPVLETPRMQSLMEGNWSHRLGLTSSPQKVFLLYRRHLVNQTGEELPCQHSCLYLDVMNWNSNSERFDRDPQMVEGRPVEIPITAFRGGAFQGSGYYLWAGYDSPRDRLLILTQVWQKTVTFVEIRDPLRERERFTPNIRFPSRTFERILPPGPFPSPVGPEQTKHMQTKMAEIMQRNNIPTFDPAPMRIHPQDFEGNARLGLPRTSPRSIVLRFEDIRTSLILLAAPASSPALASPDTWTILDIDDGGYDFDAVLRDGFLHTVYRQKAYAYSLTDNAIRFTMTEQVRFPFGILSNSLSFAPLHHKAIRLDTLQIAPARSLGQVDGGMAPQIQSTDPFILTVDRVKEGELILDPRSECIEPSFDFFCAATVPTTPSIRSNLEWFEKVMLRRENTTWRTITLFSFDARIVPRHINSGRGVSNHYPYFPPEVREVSGQTALYQSLDSYRPVYLLDRSDLIKKLGGYLFLQKYDYSGLGSMAMVLYQVTNDRATPTNAALLDMNHLQLLDKHGLWLTDYPRGDENKAAEPFTVTWTPEPHIIDNTLGGALVASRSGNPLEFYAYLHMADGGVRAVVDAPISTDVPPKLDKYFSVDTLTGTGLGEEKAVIVEAEDWTSSELPAYLVARSLISVQPSGSGPIQLDYITPDNEGSESGALGSALHVVLDTLFFTIGELPSSLDDCGSVNAVEMTAECAQGLQTLDPVDPSPASFTEAEDGPATLSPRISVDVTRPWFGAVPIRLDGGGTTYTGFAVTDYTWDIGEASLTADDGSRISVTFPRPGTYAIRLTVSNAEGKGSPSREVEIVPDGRPRSLSEVRVERFLTNPPRVRLTWAPTPGANTTQYEVQRRPENSPVFTQLGTTANSTFVDSTVQTGEIYRYVIRAGNAAGWGPESGEIRVPFGFGPNAPTSVRAEHGEFSVNVRWAPPPGASGIGGYVLYRREVGAGSEYERIGTIASNQYMFLDTDIQRGMRYWYVVAAVAANQEGVWSRAALADLAPSLRNKAPKALSASQNNDGITLSWQPAEVAEGETIAGYRIFRRRLGEAYVDVSPGGTAVPTPTFSETLPSPEDTYYYYVVAINGTPQSRSVVANICAYSFDQRLWSIFTQFSGATTDPCKAPESAGLYSLGDADLTFGKYRFEFRDPGPNRSLRIVPLDNWKTSYRFMAQNAEYRFEIDFSSSDITVQPVPLGDNLGTLDEYVKIDSVEVQAHYSRQFTLGVAMSEVRYKDPFKAGSGGLDDSAQYFREPVEVTELRTSSRMFSPALVAKPISETTLTVPAVHVEVSFTWRLLAMITVDVILLEAIAVLMVIAIRFGLGNLWTKLGEILKDLTLGGAFLATGVIVASVLVTVAALEEGIGWYVGDAIKDEIIADKENLDQSGMMWYAGEGLAESVARHALNNAGVQLTNQAGRERLREQFWQFVGIEQGRAKIGYRE